MKQGQRRFTLLFQQTVSSLQLSFPYLYLLLRHTNNSEAWEPLSFFHKRRLACYLQIHSNATALKPLKCGSLKLSHHLQLHPSSKLLREESTLPNLLEKKQKLLTQQGNVTQKHNKYLTSFKGKTYILHRCLYVTVSILPSKIQSVNLLCKSKDRREDETKKKYIRQKVISEIVYSYQLPNSIPWSQNQT